jgi:hypothetical protein
MQIQDRILIEIEGRIVQVPCQISKNLKAIANSNMSEDATTLSKWEVAMKEKWAELQGRRSCC